MIAPVALYLALAAAAARPTVTLVVWPDGIRMWQGHALYTGARVRIDDPHRELACPEIRVDWGDGSASGVQSDTPDCDPYSPDSPSVYSFSPRLHAYREPGRFVVVACVVKVRGECAKGLVATRLVVIHGPDEGRLRFAGR